MTQLCETCHRVYDDAACNTMCPHLPLGVSGRYCRHHDLDPCPFCDPTATNPLVRPAPEMQHIPATLIDEDDDGE